MALNGDLSVRRHASWILAIGDGSTVSRLARGVSVSRPTIYRVGRAWLKTRSVSGLENRVVSQLTSRSCKASNSPPDA